MCMFVYLISREKAFVNSAKETGYVVKWGLLTLIVPAMGFIAQIYSIIAGKTDFEGGWLGRTLGAVCLSIFVGLFEELTFRVAINDSLLYRFRNSKHIFVWIAVISCLVFGLVHVLSLSAFSSPMAFSLAMLKTISTAFDGAILLVLYWKYRNVWALAIVHGIGDFPTFLESALTERTVHFGGADNYINSGLAGFVTYGLMIICAAVVFVIVWKKVGRTIDFEEIRKTW